MTMGYGESTSARAAGRPSGSPGGGALDTAPGFAALPEGATTPRPTRGGPETSLTPIPDSPVEVAGVVTADDTGLAGGDLPARKHRCGKAAGLFACAMLACLGCACDNQKPPPGVSKSPPWEAQKPPQAMRYADPCEPIATVAYRLRLEVWLQTTDGWSDITAAELSAMYDGIGILTTSIYIVWGPERYVTRSLQRLTRTFGRGDPPKLLSGLDGNSPARRDPLFECFRGDAGAAADTCPTEIVSGDDLVWASCWMTAQRVGERVKRMAAMDVGDLARAAGGGYAVRPSAEPTVRRLRERLEASGVGGSVRVHIGPTHHKFSFPGTDRRMRSVQWAKTPLGTFCGRWESADEQSYSFANGWRSSSRHLGRRFLARDLGLIESHEKGVHYCTTDKYKGQKAWSRLTLDRLIVNGRERK